MHHHILGDIYKTLNVEECRWRVENGKFINIWTNYWLLVQKKNMHKLVQDSYEQTLTKKVASLIEQHTRWWDI